MSDDGEAITIELSIQLQDSEQEPFYFQIYDHIRNKIVEGVIKQGTRLPSIRHLSEQLGISRTPVEQAYGQLHAEGYIQSRPRSGLFVLHVDALYAYRSTAPPSSDFGNAPPSVRYDFGYGGVDLEHFPFAKWRKYMNEWFLPEHRQVFQYGDLQGEEGLRRELAGYLHGVRGVNCTPEQIIIGAGTYHSFDLLLQLLKPLIRQIATEEAVNDGIRSLYEQHAIPFYPLTLEQDGVRLEDLRTGEGQAVYITPSHQFPYGMALSAVKRFQLLQWAETHNSYIIENDYDGEFRYTGRPIPSLQSLDRNGRVVYLGTFSQALTPAFRLSYLVLPYALLHRYRQGLHSYDQLASPLHQLTLQRFMQTGDLERHMRRMRKLYKSKQNLLVQELRNHMGNKVEIIGQETGLHLLVRVHAGMTEQELIRQALMAGIRVYPVSTYQLIPADCQPFTVLLGFGGLTLPEISQAVPLLADAWGLKP